MLLLFNCQCLVLFFYRITTVFVSIEDVNDNYPEFSLDQYSFVMSESAGIGFMSTVLSGAVTDIDAGANAQFTFSLSNTSKQQKVCFLKKLTLHFFSFL